MRPWQKVVKYGAMAFAILLIVSIISGIMGAASSMTLSCGGGIQCGGENVVGETKTYEMETMPTDLDIEIPAARLEIKSGEKFYVESNYKYLSVEEEIKEDVAILRLGSTKEKIGAVRGEAVVSLYVPKGTAFQNVDITTGAGTVEIAELTAKTIVMKFGAGEVLLKNITATQSTELEGGAGKITLENGELRDLDLEMGVGELNFTGKLAGNSSLEMGVGEANVTLLGGKENYSINVHKGLGEAKIENEKVTDGTVIGVGESKIELHGGIGAIQVRFS